jgi:5-hydroxyisourate hydrolase
MSGITTHVLDLSAGQPAAGISVTLEIEQPGRGWLRLAQRTTDSDGRVKDMIAAGSALDAGRYRLTFETGPYFAARNVSAFHPQVVVAFDVREPAQSYHVPLLLSPFGYSTYRGS